MSFNTPHARFAAAPAAVLLPVTDRRRPRLLLTAARHGLALYRRDRDLPRLMARSTGQSALDALTESEARIEAARRSGAANYSFARHVEALVALLAERRLQPQT